MVYATVHGTYKGEGGGRKKRKGEGEKEVGERGNIGGKENGQRRRAGREGERREK